jgi:thymidine phosphorylase
MEGNMNSKTIIDKKVKNKSLTYDEIEYMVMNFLNGKVHEKTMT